MKIRLAAVSLLFLAALPVRADYLDPKRPETLTSLRSRAQAGDASAMAVLAWALRYGIGVERKPDLSLELMKMSSEAGNPYGLFLLCEASDDGFGQPRDPAMAQALCTQALPGLKELAPQDAYAQYMLGYLYDHGLGGLKRNPEEASRWYQLSAAQGHPFAMNNLGFLYSQKQDFEQALKWYKRAAEQGDPSGMVNLGYAYQHGQGAATDFAAALKWYKLAAEGGDPAAFNNIGSLYAEGQGVTKSREEAVKWYRKAAEQGYAIAQYNLGLAYLLGQGAEQSDVEALSWLVKAAEQDLEEAQFEAGRLYLDGNGVVQNREQARHWLELATAKGHRQAQDLLNRRF
ncbi:MAG TPA: tetratricopeptide repeat protein [Candidatus Obscuribacterales bacterium]